MLRASGFVVVVFCWSLVAGCGGRRALEPASTRVTSALSSDPAAVILLPPCVTKFSATESWATFGYDSGTAQTVVVAAGATNGFTPLPADRGQPTRFDPGLHASAFSVRFDGAPLTWKLGARTVTANSTSPACPAVGSTTAPVLGQFVLYGQVDVRLDRVTVMGGDVGVAGTNLMTDGRDEVTLEPNGRVDPKHSVFGHTVDLRGGAVMGRVFTTRLDNGGGTVVSVGPFPAVMPALPAIDPVVPGTNAVTVASGQTQTLSPGAYGGVQVTGTLTLTGGTYQLASLDLFQPGRLEAAAGTRLRIKGHLYMGPSTRLRTNPVGLARDLVVEMGTGDGNTAVLVDSDTELHALVLAPTGTIQLHPRVNARGAFAAREIRADADAKVTFESGFPLPIKDCIAGFQIDPAQASPGSDPQDLAHTIAATACLAPDATSCEVTFIANANFDRRTAAKRLVAGIFTPAQYLALVRDRSRKVSLAEKDASWTPAFCRGDAAGDLVPDDRDACAGTPPLTPTDNRGCTDSTLPAAPDPIKIKNDFDHSGLLISATCDGAREPLPPVITDVCLDRANLRYLFTVSKDLQQPSRCQLWYQMTTFAVERFEAREKFNAFLTFERGQAVAQTATTVTVPLPLTCDPTVETPGDGLSWPCDEVNGDAFNTIIAVRAVNGNGQQSPWGPARQFPFHLCQ